MFRHGVVAGKFYPLHMGHDLVIRTALARCERVTILVIPRPGERPPGPVRRDALVAAYPVANVLMVADLVLDDDDPAASLLWAEYTRDVLDDAPIDAVFTSEPYGERWASALGAEHVLVDRARDRWPISGTAIRADPYRHWDVIHPEARGPYVKKILIVGPESTGKSTLARRLAHRYSTLFVPEFARIYVERKGSLAATNYRIIFAEILNRQPRLEDDITRRANRLVFCDTDLTSTHAWYHLWQPEAVGDALDQAILEEAVRRQPTYDLVLISSHAGAPWVDDNLRDQPHSREWFTAELRRLFARHPNTALLDQPTWRERERQAIHHVNQLFAGSAWQPPVPEPPDSSFHPNLA